MTISEISTERGGSFSFIATACEERIPGYCLICTASVGGPLFSRVYMLALAWMEAGITSNEACIKHVCHYIPIIIANALTVTRLGATMVTETFFDVCIF